MQLYSITNYNENDGNVKPCRAALRQRRDIGMCFQFSAWNKSSFFTNHKNVQDQRRERASSDSDQPGRQYTLIVVPQKRTKN